MSESQAHASGKLAAWLAEPGHGVAVVGASGWVGRALAHVGLAAAGPEARFRLFSSRAGTAAAAGRALPMEALAGAAPLGGGEWIVAHLAVAGADRIPDPAERRARNEAMLADALALAASGRVRRLICASSGAVYAGPDADPDRQAYNDLKRDQEQVARAWAARAGVPLLLPRIFNLGGPYMNHVERYALGDMIRQATANGGIRIQARRPVVRSYVHVLEFARVAFDLALAPEPSITFDTAGAEAVEMGELAEAIGRALDMPGLRIERAPLEAGAAPDRYVGGGALYRAALGGAPVGLDQIIRDTAAWIAKL